MYQFECFTHIVRSELITKTFWFITFSSMKNMLTHSLLVTPVKYSLITKKHGNECLVFYKLASNLKTIFHSMNRPRNPSIEALRRKFRSARTPYGGSSIWRKYRTAKFQYGESSIRQKLRTAKIPYGKNSMRR